MYLNRTIGTIATLWGVAGATAVLSLAISRMAGFVLEIFSAETALTPAHYVVMGLWTAFMAYSEGYKGFQKSYSPRVAARALYLRDHCTTIRLVLAPLFCMGFFHSTRRRKITLVVLMCVITAIVMLFRMIPQPWRGVLDVGVVVGLSWGILATLVFLIKSWNSTQLPCDPEVV